MNEISDIEICFQIGVINADQLALRVCIGADRSCAANYEQGTSAAEQADNQRDIL